MKMRKPSYADAVRAFGWGTVLRDLEWQDQAHINLGHTIIDRHASGHDVALYWIGRKRSRVIMTYREMRALSNKVANLLRSLGLRKGDRIAGILPRVPETLTRKRHAVREMKVAPAPDRRCPTAISCLGVESLPDRVVRSSSCPPAV